MVLMEERSREHLIGKMMGFNQMRNSIYWLQRFMTKKNVSEEEIETRLKEMGKNIGSSFLKTIHSKPSGLKELVEFLYKETVNSSVDVGFIQEKNSLLIKDEKCALCKYSYDDIKVAGCTIEVGMISQILNELGIKISDSAVIKSKTNGDSLCMHAYKLEGFGGEKNE